METRIKTALDGFRKSVLEAHGMDFLIVGSLALQEDRKSTRLNSSHVRISYAVFCLKKKNNKKKQKKKTKKQVEKSVMRR